MIARGKDMSGADSEAFRRRAALIARLAADPRQLAAEQVMPATPDARLATLLSAINDIILPRVLCVKVGTRDLARLVVSQRRLISLDMPGRPAPPSDPAALALIFAPRLMDIARTPADMSLATHRRARAPSQAELGCSVAALRQALDMTPTESAHGRLLRLAEPHMLARLTWSDKLPAPRFEGQPAWQSPLVTIADRYRKTRQAPRTDARASAQRCDGVLVPVSTELAVLVAVQGRQGCAALLPLAVALKVVSTWQQG